MEVISALVLGGPLAQSRFICQVLCSGMQVISALVLGGPSAKVGSSAKFCVVVCKSSLLWYWGGSLAEEGLSAKFVVAVFKASILDYLGDPSAKVGLSAKFGVAVFQTSMLHSWGIHLPKYVHLPSFVYWYSRQIITCQSWNLLLSFGGVEGVFRGLHLTCLYNANWLFTTQIIQKITGNSHLFLKNPKWLPNLSHNIYPMMHLGVGVHLSGDLPRSAFNNNITYYTWQIWLLIVEICKCYVRGVLGMFWGVKGVTSDMTVQCSLTVYNPNYSEIKGNSHLFLKNPTWLPHSSHNIYPMMHLGGGGNLLTDLPRSSLTTIWQTKPGKYETS